MPDLIPADVLMVLIGFVVGALSIALGAVGILALGRAVQHKRRVSARLAEPSTYGDDGGHPKPTAPETGSGRPGWTNW